MGLVKDKFEGMLKASPIMKNVVNYVNTIASDVVRIGQAVIDLQADVKVIIEHVKAQQIALQQMYDAQTATVKAMKGSSMDVSLPGGKKPTDTDKKPN